MQSSPGGGSQRVAKGSASAPARRFSLAGRRQSLPLAEREVDGVVGYKYGPCSTLTGARARARPRDHEALPGKTAGRAKKKCSERRARGGTLPAEDNEDGAEDKADQRGRRARALFRAAARRQHRTVPAGAASQQKGPVKARGAYLAPSGLWSAVLPQPLRGYLRASSR
ncbi:hypothetical protein HPB52_013211 [Rhipicephalus sanguineus]|uniref:Uncharacterized protein n=1 Tax=Rhipicephalus sanguineus TaxID=34632 RepID=A0A9D4QA26_RHISA|nr:hypothetical protein HPB52_013211 [Rhipicephalus sanguineus]